MTRRPTSAEFDKDGRSLGEQLLALSRQAREQRSKNARVRTGADNLALKLYQTNRLAHTHADLRADPRYRPAVDFFLTEVYSPKDFSVRDSELARVVPLMVKMLPNRALSTLVNAVRMDALTESLDADMVRALRRDGKIKNIDSAAYASAYRSCGRKADREMQIALLSEIGNALDKLRHVPILKTMLKLMRLPAHYAGFESLQSFLEQGYDAFYQMNGVDEFLHTITSRELEFSQVSYSR